MENKKKDKKISKIIFWSIIFCLYGFQTLFAPINQAVTYFWGGGRFGDKIISYTTAKWISYKFGIPLLLKPFKHSDMLRLGKEENKFSKEIIKQFSGNVIPIASEQDIQDVIEQKENAIFES
ncbi:MAG: hypothetical protein WCD44_04225, partial [Candidatus Babeliales bacterium]